MSKLENPILIGVVGAAQGIRGEVRVKPFTEDPMAIAEYGALYSEDGRRFEVLDHRLAKTVVVVRFRGINDRNAAEALEDAGGVLEKGRIAVDVSVLDDRIVVRLADTGPGIPDRIQDRLFQPFGGSARSGGTGLGLAISRELAAGLGGELRLERTGKEGTAFLLTLPKSDL